MVVAPGLPLARLMFAALMLAPFAVPPIIVIGAGGCGSDAGEQGRHT
jgi:hypothetical protein